MTIKKFQNRILAWHKKHRRDLPFRRTKNPYRILVSEVMLQQTQLNRVLPKYQEFLKEFPNLTALAASSTRHLLSVWQGLGYWRRALFLRQTARVILKKYRGKIPADPKILETFPGIGPYTAYALGCFAFGNKEAFLDTNIRRVYLHFFFRNKKEVFDKEIVKIAQKAVWKKNPREWHYALFDYGSVVIKDKKINAKSAHYDRQSKFAGSFRSFRSKALRFVLAHPDGKISRAKLSSFLQKELKKHNGPFSPGKIISALVKDGLLKKRKHYYVL